MPTAANDVIDGVYVPVFMYHSVLKHVDPNEKYIVSLDNLESDIKYLKENGYNTVLFTDLVNYTKNEAKLPPNPVMLTLTTASITTMLICCRFWKNTIQKQ